MYAMERQDLIERMLLDDGRVSVVALARRFDVTTETVRRDLAQLEIAGALHRVHGGAVLRERQSTTEPTLAERAHRRSGAKAAIGRRALELLGDRFRGSLFLDAGTTTSAIGAQLGDHLAATGGQAEVVTHAMTLAHALADVRDAELTVIGGRVRGTTLLRSAPIRCAPSNGCGRTSPFLGTNGISATFGLSTPDPDEAAVKSAIVQSARRVVVVADAEKLGRELLVSFASLAEIDVLVTDAAPDAELTDALAAVDVEVLLP